MTENYKHGLTGWVKHKCRCNICKGAHAAANARWRTKITEASREAQRASNRRYKQKQAANRNPLQKRIDSGVPDDWTW